MRVSRTAVPPWSTLLLTVVLACASGTEGPTAPDPGNHPINPIPGDLWRPSYPALGNWVLVTSQTGDWLGQGKKWVVADVNGDQVYPYQYDGASTITVFAAPWFATFTPMDGMARLAQGYYPHAEGGATKYHGGFGWMGDGRACMSVTGWFAVDSVRYAGDSLVALDVRSEQHCDGGAAPLYAAVHWRK